MTGVQTCALPICERRKGLLESVDYIDVSLPEQPVLSYLNLEPTEPWPVY